MSVVDFRSEQGKQVKERAVQLLTQIKELQAELEEAKESVSDAIWQKYDRSEIEKQIEERYQDELKNGGLDKAIKLLYEEAYAGQVQKLLDDTMKALESPDPKFIINDPIPPELPYYGFKNGIYNWKTREFITEPDRLINCLIYRGLEFPEQLPTETPLLDWIVDTFSPCLDSTIRPYLKSVIALLATGRWVETGRVLHMGGDPGVGKTTLMLMVSKALEGLVLGLSGSAFENWLTDKNSQYKAIGKSLVWFDEPKRTHEIPEEIKAVTGVRGKDALRKRWVEDKYVASTEVWIGYGFVLTYNTIPYTSVAAVEAMEPWRRAYMIEWTKPSNHKENPNLLTEFEEKGGGDQLFLECLSLLTPELLESFYVLPDKVVSRMEEILYNQINPLRDMIDECTEPDYNSLVTHPAMDELINWYYRHNCNVTDSKYNPSSHKSTQKIYLHMKSLGYAIPDKERKTKRLTIKSVGYRGIWGLKIKPEYWQRIKEDSTVSASFDLITKEDEGITVYHVRSR